MLYIFLKELVYGFCFLLLNTFNLNTTVLYHFECCNIVTLPTLLDAAAAWV